MNIRSLFYPALRFDRKFGYLIQNRVVDYDTDQLTELIAQADAKNLAQGKFDYCPLFEFIPEAQSGSHVLDFGGGGGRHGYKALDGKVSKWVVLETDSMVRSCQRYIKKPGLEFQYTLEAAKANGAKFDIVHVSSSLQYTPAPEVLLKKLLSLEAEYVLFEKLVLTRGSQGCEFWQYSKIRDNIPKTDEGVRYKGSARYRLIAMTEHAFIDAVSVQYEVVKTWKDPVQSHLPAFKGLFQCGFLLQRRTQS